MALSNQSSLLKSARTRPKNQDKKKAPSPKPQPDTFRDRFDPKYRELLLRTLDISQLKKTAIPAKGTRNKNKRIIRVHFYGVAATSLFDGSGQFNPANVATSEAFKNLCARVADLNKQGYVVQVRLLLVYPYSEYALSRMQAEKTRRRSARNSSKYIRDFDLIEDIDIPMFYGSSVYTNQYRCLEQIERLLADYPELTKEPNEFRVRFTTVGTNLCLLIVNRAAFWDTYMYAKDHLDQDVLTSASPLIWVQEAKDPTNFERLEDHFRYKWTLDTTLYCQDATHYDERMHRGLSKIKQPDEVGFNFKATRIQQGMEQAKKRIPSSTDIMRWKFVLRNKFRQETRSLGEIPKMESVFISCSWRDAPKGSGSHRIPSTEASQVKHWLQADFPEGKDSGANCLAVNLFEAALGQELQESMYRSMQDSSLAIFIVTAEHKISKDLYATSANVWIELGYFQRHLKAPKHLCILHDKRVKVPSNLANITTEEFDDKDFMSKYYRILDWLTTSEAAIPQEYIERAKHHHDERGGRPRSIKT